MPTSETVPCSMANARVRPDKEDDLRDLLRTLFERRNHPMIAGNEKQWMTVELIQSLRRKSDVYREHLSGKMTGPLPFALGYLRLHNGAVDFTTDEVPANVEPEVLACLLSEYLQPGAELSMQWKGTQQQWIIRDRAEVDRVSPRPDDDLPGDA